MKNNKVLRNKCNQRNVKLILKTTKLQLKEIRKI